MLSLIIIDSENSKGEFRTIMQHGSGLTATPRIEILPNYNLLEYTTDDSDYLI